MDKFPIYKMIIDDNSDTGLNAVALVDQPAIERMWMKFNAEIFIEPQAGETQSEFLSRCIPAMIDEGKEQDQAIAMCISMYNGKLEQIDREQKLKFAVQNEERRIVTGPLMIANLPIYRKSPDGFEFYVVFDADTIEQLVMKYYKAGLQHSVNLMHNGIQVEGVYMFESFIVDSQRGIAAPKGFENVPDGSWFGSYKIENEEVWNLVKAGKFRGFSVEGIFLKKLITASDEQVIDKLKELLS
jgi:hypothetical protein